MATPLRKDHFAAARLDGRRVATPEDIAAVLREAQR